MIMNANISGIILPILWRRKNYSLFTRLENESNGAIVYYSLDWRAKSANADFSNTESSPDLDIPWSMGIFYPDPLPEPIKCKLHPERGDKLRDVYLIDLPLFSDKFVEILTNAGIDNLQLFSAEIIDKQGVSHYNYKAVNIVGAVSCANLKASEYLPESEPPLMCFNKLVIDVSRVRDQKLFRLAEDTSQIILSQEIKEKIEQAGLVGFSLQPVESA